VSGLLDTQIKAAGLAGLPGMTPVRLAKLLDGFHPVLAWKAVQAGAHPADPRRKFAASARTTDLAEVESRYRRAGARILLPDMRDYPSMLVGDPGAPAVLFALGDPTVLEGRPRVAIVGTRSATHYGRQVASDLARELAAEGVVVVSGLARGIDGAAHAGSLRAGLDSAAPVAVVGTGLDVIYPPSNHELWEQVATRGAVLSESALGTKPHPGVFPARNRIIAALSDVVVVVESHHNGGSLYTADAAARRSIPVCAVPGSVRSRASDGTNGLLVDGCTPVRDAADVLVAVSLARAGAEELHPDARPTGVHRQTSGSGMEEIGGPETGATHSASGRSGSADAGQGRSGQGRSGQGRSGQGRSGQTRSGQANSDSARSRPADSDSARSNPAHRTVLDAIDDVPTRLETILIRTGLSIAAAAEACDHLAEQGVIISGAGWWSRNQPERSLAGN
jgi:DNA processing protein